VRFTLIPEFSRPRPLGFRHSLIMLAACRVLAVYANYFKVNHYFCLFWLFCQLLGRPSSILDPWSLSLLWPYLPADGNYEWMRFILSLSDERWILDSLIGHAAARQLESISNRWPKTFECSNNCNQLIKNLLPRFLGGGLCTFLEPQVLLLLTVNWNYTF